MFNYPVQSRNMLTYFDEEGSLSLSTAGGGGLSTLRKDSLSK